VDAKKRRRLSGGRRLWRCRASAVLGQANQYNARYAPFRCQVWHLICWRTENEFSLRSGAAHSALTAKDQAERGRCGRRPHECKPPVCGAARTTLTLWRRMLGGSGRRPSVLHHLARGARWVPTGFGQECLSRKHGQSPAGPNRVERISPSQLARALQASR